MPKPKITKEINRAILLECILTIFNDGYYDRIYTGTFKKWNCASSAHIDRLSTKYLCQIGRSLVTEALMTLPEVLADTAWKDRTDHESLDLIDNLTAQGLNEK